MRELIRRVGRLQRLAVFEAAARLGSFTAAARELGMTQPAVTRQLRALEASVNTALFRRTSNRSELTDAGRTLLLEVSRSFSGIEGALAGLGQRAELFVLACYPGFAQQWLVPRLDRVQEALGGRELRLWLFDREADLSGLNDALISSISSGVSSALPQSSSSSGSGGGGFSGGGGGGGGGGGW